MISLSDPFALAAQSAIALVLSHGLCCGIIMYYDLTGKWAKYTLHKTRCVSVQDYIDGAKSLFADLFLLFLPFLTICYWFREKEIRGKSRLFRKKADIIVKGSDTSDNISLTDCFPTIKVQKTVSLWL